MEKLKNNINDLILDSITPYQLENLKELQACYDARKSFYKKAYIGPNTEVLGAKNCFSGGIPNSIATT